MTFSVWFDGDDTLWDRKGYMLTGLLEPAKPLGDPARETELFSDVLPTFVDLTDIGPVNLIEYAPMPDGHEDLLPPFQARVEGPPAPSDVVAPELHATASTLHWVEVCDRIAEHAKDADDVLIVSNSAGPFAEAAERGWMTVWLNRDRVANLSEVVPTVEIHSLLDLPEALETLDEARAALASSTALDAEPTATA